MHYYRTLLYKQHLLPKEKKKRSVISHKLRLLHVLVSLDVTQTARDLRVPLNILLHIQKGFIARASRQTLHHLVIYYQKKLLEKMQTSSLAFLDELK